MATAAKKSSGTGSTGKRYLNTHYGKPIFGGHHGFAPTARSGVNPRAGMTYTVGVTPKGEVVHIYRDGERIVMHQHGQHAAPPHPASFGGTVAPDSTFQTDQANTAYVNNAAALQAAHASATKQKDSAAHQAARQAALQAALAHFSGA